jgi:hypothetical protein
MDLIPFIAHNSTVIAALIGGGLAGAVFREVIVNWWSQPNLSVIFDENDPGCALNDIPGLRCDENGREIARGQQSYLRIRINNKGRSTAHGVTICVTKIEFFSNGGDEHIFDEEVLELPVALSERTTFDLPRDGHRWVDLFCVEDFGKGVERRFAFLKPSGRLYLRPYGAGKYYATIFASSNNSSSEHAKVCWRWDGRLIGLHILGCLRLSRS